MDKEYIFRTNPQKSANKVTINSFMMGSLFLVLTLVVALDPSKFPNIIIFQLFLAIPLLYVSSLAYSKIGYWKETYEWNALGWLTNTTGNLFVVNSIGLLALKFSLFLAHIYFSLFCLLMVIYTYINIKHNKKIWPQKVFKLIFLLVIIFFGGILFALK